MNYEIDMVEFPRVLLLGNGMLKLGNKGKSWKELLNDIQTRVEQIKVDNVPYAMQPEALCGVDVEEIQRRVAKHIDTSKEVHPLLCDLLELPFDAILAVGKYDNIAAAKYEVPGYRDIGKVFERLIEDVTDENDPVEGIREVYSSRLAGRILNFNSDL